MTKRINTGDPASSTTGRDADIGMKANPQTAAADDLGGGAETIQEAEPITAGLIDLSAVRIPPGGIADVAEKLLVYVPVRKPGKTEFVRTHPDPEYTVNVFVVQLPGDEPYLVQPSIAAAIPDLAKAVRLILYVTRQGNPGLWPVKLGGEDGRQNPWHTSAMTAAEKAKTKWVRITANQALGAYDITVAKGILAEPQWPKRTMAELVTKGFANRHIDSEGHPVLRELLGEV